MRLFATLVSVVMLIGGCAAAPENALLPSDARTVALALSLPTQFRIATTGLTVFENALDVVDSTSWGLDQAVADAATQALKPRYEVRRASVSGQVGDWGSKLDHALGGSRDFEKLVSERVRVDGAADLIVIVGTGYLAQRHSGLKDVFIDIGVSKMRNPFVTEPPLLHAFLQVSVLDGRTGKLIAAMPLKHRPVKRAGLRTPMDSPSDLLEGFAWKNSWAEMAPDQQALLRERTGAILARSVPYTLSLMGLAPSAKGDGATISDGGER